MPTELDIESLPSRVQALAARASALEVVAALALPDDVDAAAFDALDSASAEVAERLEDEIQPAVTALDAALKAMQAAVDASAQLARDTRASLEANVSKVVQTGADFHAHVSEQCKQIQAHADQEYADLHRKLDALHDATQALMTAAQGFTQSFPERSGAFSTRVGSESMARLEEHARATAQALESALASTAAQLRATAGALDAELQAQFGRLEQAAGSGIRNHLESAGQRIVDSALRQVANAIAGSIMQMTVGVQLTSMMSPILPQMIVLNKCADALLELIEVYKKMKSMGGGLL